MKNIASHRLARAVALCMVSIPLLAVTPAALNADEIPARALTPPDYPTVVFVSLFDVEVFDIDEQQETFLIEADLMAEWHDPRLAFAVPGDVEGPVPPARFEEEAAKELLKTIWWPSFELVDGRGSRDQMRLSIAVYPDGTVTYWERFTGLIKQNLDLSTFPYDSHDISFTVGPFSEDAETVVFQPFEDERLPTSWQPNEWLVYDPELVVLPGFSCSESGQVCAADGECPAGETCDAGWASAGVHMSIAREPDHYKWKIILPLTLIVLASSAVFWLDLKRFPDPGDRLAISFTGVLTVVAFDFVSSGDLPKLFYTTVLDRILLLAYVFLAINILLNVVSTQLSGSRPEACRRSDLLGRWVYPLTFLVGLWILMP